MHYITFKVSSLQLVSGKIKNVLISPFDYDRISICSCFEA